MIISIHALHEESDTRIGSEWSETSPFQSTLSMRRATQEVAEHLDELRISIHALHEESDTVGNILSQLRKISIHALHEESDVSDLEKIADMFDFNPRSP